MQTHRRKKIEMIVEAPLLRRAEEILEASGVRVYTVFDGREGQGLSAQAVQSAEPADQRLIVAIATDEAAEAVFTAMAGLFKRYPGVIWSSDVEVMRAERF